MNGRRGFLKLLGFAAAAPALPFKELLTGDNEPTATVSFNGEGEVTGLRAGTTMYWSEADPIYGWSGVQDGDIWYRTDMDPPQPWVMADGEWRHCG